MIDLVQDLAQAQTLVENGRFQEAFPRLNHLKAQKKPLPELDYFRALCFLDRHQPWSAMEALKEELRYCPDNAKASVLLAQLSAQHPVKATLGDKEFQTLIRYPVSQVPHPGSHARMQIILQLRNRFLLGQDGFFYQVIN